MTKRNRTLLRVGVFLSVSVFVGSWLFLKNQAQSGVHFSVRVLPCEQWHFGTTTQQSFGMEQRVTTGDDDTDYTTTDTYQSHYCGPLVMVRQSRAYPFGAPAQNS